MPRRRGGDIRLYTDQSPCYKCPRRWRTDTQSCHDTCEEYAKYKRKTASTRKQREEAKKKSNEFYGYLSGKRDTPAR